METIANYNEVNKLTDMTKFSDTVNRQIIMKSAGGVINLIALKRNQGMSEHVAPADAMVYVNEGRVIFTVEGQEKALNGGEFMVMKKGTPHKLHAVEDTKILLTLIIAE